MSILGFHQGPEDELTLRCDCGETHYLVFSYWSFKDETDIYIEVADMFHTPRGLWGRIKAAWYLFWKGEYHRSDFLLNNENLEAIQQWISRRKEIGGQV